MEVGLALRAWAEKYGLENRVFEGHEREVSFVSPDGQSACYIVLRATGPDGEHLLNILWTWITCDAEPAAGEAAKEGEE